MAIQIPKIPSLKNLFQRSSDKNESTKEVPKIPTLPGVSTTGSKQSPQKSLSVNSKGIFVPTSSTQTSTPQTTDRGTGDVLRDVFNVSKGVANILTTKEGRKGLSEGITKEGVSSAVSAGARGISIAEPKALRAAGNLFERINLPAQLIKSISKGRVSVSETANTVASMIEKKFSDIAEREGKIAEMFQREAQEGRMPQTFVEKFSDPEQAGRAIGANLPNLALALGAGAVGAATGGAPLAFGAAAGTGALLEGGSAYNEAKRFLEQSDNPELNKLAEDKEFLEDVAISVGGINGLLESLPITAFLSRNPTGRVLKNTIMQRSLSALLRSGTQAIEEGSTEGLQEIVSNAVAQVYDENKDLLEGVGESVFVGSILGGGSQVVTDLPSVTAGLPVGLSIKDVSGNEDLIQEARKYDSADEFVKSQGQPFYHGTNVKFDVFDPQQINTVEDRTDYAGSGFSFTDDTSKAKRYAQQAIKRKGVGEENIIEARLEMKNPLIIKTEADGKKLRESFGGDERYFDIDPDIIRDELIKRGYDSVDDRVYGQKIVFSSDQIKTKSQLTDIWNQAQKAIPTRDTKQIAMSEAFEQAEAEVFTQLDLSETGLGQEVEGGRRVRFSTFPKWIPEDLRSKSLFNKVSEMIENNEAPRGEKQRRLMEVISEEIASRVDPELVTEKELNDYIAETRALEESFNKTFRENLIKEIEGMEGTTTGRKTAQVIKQSTEGKATQASEFVRKRESTLLKDRIRNISRGVREGRTNTKSEVQEVQGQIIDIIDQSNLDLNDKAKFRRTIKNVQTREQLQKSLPEIEGRISRLETASEYRSARASVVDIIKKTKPDTKTGKPVGKLTPDLQDMFNRFREYLKLNQEKASELLEKNLENDAQEISFIQSTENTLLAMLAGSDRITNEDVRQLAEDLDQLVQEGRVSNELSLFNRKAEIDRRIDLVVDRVQPEGSIDGRASFGTERETIKSRIKQEMITFGKGMVFDWHGLMDMLDFKSAAEDRILSNVFGTVEQDNTYKGLQSSDSQQIVDMVTRSYNLEAESTRQAQRNAEKQLSKNAQEEVNLGELTNTEGVTRELVLTRDEVIKRWMEIQDPTLTESFILGNKWSQEFFEAIERAMRPEDVRFAQAQLGFYRGKYEAINDIYKRLYGVNLPFNEFYSPIRREGFRVDLEKAFNEFVQEVNYRASVSPGAIKSRVATIQPLTTQGSMDALNRHITEMNYFIAWAEKIREFHQVFFDPKVREVVQDEYGSDLLRKVQHNIQDFASNASRFADMEHRIVNAARKNFTIAALAIKPQIAWKQTLSIFAYLEPMNSLEFSKGVGSFLANPVANARTLLQESTFLRTRGENIERDIKFATQSDTFKRYKKSSSFVNFLMLNVQMGDIAPILMGSWAIRQKALKEGRSLEEAIKEYENFGSATQQSSDVSRLSELQRSTNPFSRLITMFKTSPNQYFRKEISAWRDLLVKGLDKNQKLTSKTARMAARRIVIYHFLLPMTFQFFGSLQFLGGIDEEDREDLLRAAILGSFNGWFLVGDVIDNIVRSSLGMKVFPNEDVLTTIGKDISKALLELPNLFDSDVDEVFEALDALSKATTNITGIPVEQAIQISKGVGDIAQGSVDRGLLRIMGWSDWTISQQLSGGGSGGGRKKSLLPSGGRVQTPQIPKLPQLPQLPQLPKIPTF